ncbi:MAG: tetrathionate reductase subunit A [Myxococcota bacterium]
MTKKREDKSEILKSAEGTLQEKKPADEGGEGEGYNLTRRTFIKASATLAGVAAVAPVFIKAREAAAEPPRYTEEPPDDVETADDIIYSTCQMCHSRCGIRAKVKNGVLVKLDGNPYHPNTKHTDERPQYSADPASDEILKRPGRLCPRGQAGIQTVYDPYRITQPLKRVGARGAGLWQAIEWDQAFKEIAERINQIIPVEKRSAEYIDPSNPKLGYIANLLGFSPGRTIEKEMSERVWKSAWGTVNYGLSHTSICEVSRHVANELITWDPKASSKKNRLGAGRTSGWMADIVGAKYVILWGSNLLEAGFPMQYAARNIVQFKREGGKLVVIDPRFSNTATKADVWVPVRPGGDLSLALAMLHYIIENKRYDAEYLENTNKDAAKADNHTTWTDSTYLVGAFTDAEGKSYQRYITALEAGVAGGGVADDDYVIIPKGGSAPAGYSTAAHGEILLPAPITLNIGGQNVEALPAFQVFSNSILSESRSLYAEDSGVQLSMIEEIAEEMSDPSRRRQSVAMTYRGPVKHTNGLYAQLAIQHINTMLGNYDWRGGCMPGGGGHKHTEGAVKLDKIKDAPARTGIPIERHGKFYDPTDAGALFKGYPAKRPWGPFWTHTNYQEVIPSIADGYPYTMKVLITYWNAMPYAVPGLKNVWEETLSDESKIELLVAISPVMGEVAAWADYILPDTTYLEKFAIPGIPWNASGGTAIQRPVVGKLDGKPITAQIDLNATNEYTPVLPKTKTILDIQIGLAKALNLPGFGDGALLDGDGNSVGDLNNAWDWFHSILQNIEKSSGVSIDEILAKGGVFWNPGDEYVDGPAGTSKTHLKGQYGNVIQLFINPIAQTKDSITGEYYNGTPRRTPVAFHDGAPLDKEDADYPYRLITYKTVWHGQARTAVNPWLMLDIPANTVDISTADARSLGIYTGDEVRVMSPSNMTGIIGKARVTEGLRPGVVAISHHYGHWELSSKPFKVKNAAGEWESVSGDPSRGAGITMNPIARLDRYNRNTAIQEAIGGSVSFFDTRVRLEKV